MTDTVGIFVERLDVVHSQNYKEHPKKCLTKTFYKCVTDGEFSLTVQIILG